MSKEAIVIAMESLILRDALAVFAIWIASLTLAMTEEGDTDALA